MFPWFSPQCGWVEPERINSHFQVGLRFSGGLLSLSQAKTMSDQPCHIFGVG